MSAKVKKGENPEEEKEGKKKKSKLTLIILGIPVILAILMVALVPLIAISGGSVIYAGYQVLKEKVLDGVEHFTERIKNLFTGYGWQTDDKAAQKQEELYYKELERVYKDSDWQKNYCYIETDWHPGRILSSVAQRTWISELSFPEKHVMKIDLLWKEVTYRYKFDAEIETLIKL